MVCSRASIIMSTKIENMDLVVSQLPSGATYSEFLTENARQRGQTWLIKNKRLGYGIVKYEDAKAFLRNPKLQQAGHSTTKVYAGTGTIFDDIEDVIDLSHLEGKDHHRIRRIVASSFSSKSIDKLRPFMRDHVQDIVDKLHLSSDSISFEFQEAFESYPAAIICHHLGVPVKDWKLFNHWSSILPLRWTGFIVGREQEYVDTAMEFINYCQNLIDEKRTNPSDDLVSMFIQTADEEDTLSNNEIMGLIVGLITGGIDTVRNQLATMMSVIIESPETFQTLKKDNSLIENAVEESFRYKKIFRTVARQVAEEFEYKGVIFSPGQIITISLASSDHDESIFANPDEFIIDRENASKHLSFSNGIHTCLGSILARAELQEALRVFVKNWSSIKLNGEEQWKDFRIPFWGPETLPLNVVRESSFIHH